VSNEIDIKEKKKGSYGGRRGGSVVSLIGVEQKGGGSRVEASIDNTIKEEEEYQNNRNRTKPTPVA